MRLKTQSTTCAKPVKGTNAKAQMSNQVQMSKCQIWTLNSGIDLAFGF